MKRTIEKEASFCDKCGKEDYYPVACMVCGTEMCYECRKEHGVSYNHAVFLQGSGDGFYCHPCDVKLTASGNDKRHNAYRVIKSLREELDAWQSEFTKRQKAAERVVRGFTG